MQSDEFTQEQLQHFAEQVRRAVAGDLSVIIACGDSDKIEGAQQTQCAISGKTGSHDARRQQTEALVALMRVADHLLSRSTGGKMRLLIDGPGMEPQALGDVTPDRFEISSREAGS